MTENEFNGKIAENLAFYRRLNGLTQAELADCLSYSDKSVSKWERGNGIPGVFILMRISEIYGVTLSELIGQTGRCRETADKIKAAEKDRRAIEKAKKKAIERAKKQKRKK